MSMDTTTATAPLALPSTCGGREGQGGGSVGGVVDQSEDGDWVSGWEGGGFRV